MRPQPFDGCRHSGQGRLDVGIGRRVPERQAKGAGGEVAAHAHGREHMARILGSAGARRCGRGQDVVLLEQEQHRFALDAFEGEVTDVRQFSRPVGGRDIPGHGALVNSGQRSTNAIGQPIPHRPDTGNFP